ncbi:MAG: AsmA family protein [Elusimicrobia bacterium]|nr:AsmA family protein [Elusimicrobiota bacterium]
MKRLLKGLAVITFVGGGALLGLGVWLRHQYPSDRIRQLGGDWVGARMGRQVEIADAHVSLLHGVELKGVRISEAPTFSEGTFIEVERVRILPRLLPLLSHQIILRSIDVDRPRVTVRRSAEGNFNFSDLLPTASSKDTAGPPPRPPDNETPAPAKTSWATFLIDRASLSEGEILVRDDALPLTATLHRLDARITGFSLTDPFALRVKAALEIVRGKTTWKGPSRSKPACPPQAIQQPPWTISTSG